MSKIVFVFVVDTSGSMKKVIPFAKKGIQKFSTEIENSEIRLISWNEKCFELKNWDTIEYLENDIKKSQLEEIHQFIEQQDYFNFVVKNFFITDENIKENDIPNLFQTIHVPSKEEELEKLEDKIVSLAHKYNDNSKLSPAEKPQKTNWDFISRAIFIVIIFVFLIFKTCNKSSNNPIVNQKNSNNTINSNNTANSNNTNSNNTIIVNTTIYNNDSIVNNIISRNDSIVNDWKKKGCNDTITINIQKPEIKELPKNEIDIKNSMDLNYKIDDYPLGAYLPGNTTDKAIKQAIFFIQQHIDQFDRTDSLQIKLTGETDAYQFSNPKEFQERAHIKIDSVRFCENLAENCEKNPFIKFEIQRGQTFNDNKTLGFLRLYFVSDYFSEPFNKIPNTKYSYYVKTNARKGGKFRAVKIEVHIQGKPKFNQ